MAKKFKITGTCIPGKDYMADTSEKLKKAIELVEGGEYFAINRPRQYGKTTTLVLLENQLRQTAGYLVFGIRFAGIGDAAFELESTFCQKFVGLLANDAKYSDSTLVPWLEAQITLVPDLAALSDCISRLVEKTGKKVVLIIDEVDKSSNNQLFVSFLGMLRDKYLAAAQGKDLTFHSVILAGLYDVKSLKLKLRPDEEAKYNSPWNIAADFKVDMNLQPHEIVPMLEDYSKERSVAMDAPAIAERLFYYTSGYPFLVSAICKIADEDILPTKTEQTWSLQDIETAADMLIKSERSNTNFDTLIKNLENNADLHELVSRLAIYNETIPYNVHDPLIYLGLLHGILANGQGLRIHNRIYQEVIVNYMTSKMLTSGRVLEAQSTDPYLLPGNGLNLEKVLLKFQEFMQEQYSERDRKFLERNGRLIFLAFLKPIINAKGYAFKEPEISEEKRLDIAITFFQHRYVAELKLWRGKEAHGRGLAQLANYLDRQNLDTGYLVIFDHSAVKSWGTDWLEVEGKRVFAVWV